MNRFDRMTTREIWGANSMARVAENEAEVKATGAELMSRTNVSPEGRAKANDDQAARRYAARKGTATE